jgi:hypothetical protein
VFGVYATDLEGEWRVLVRPKEEMVTIFGRRKDGSLGAEGFSHKAKGPSPESSRQRLGLIVNWTFIATGYGDG